MALKIYVRLWLLIFIVLAFEYYSLNFKPEWSLLGSAGVSVTPDPGRPLSLALGWSGISTMMLMNLYILKKRFRTFEKFGGDLTSWLNFHIFCGLVGPTFILFHCNFKVRGLVAISFWSMLISVASGVVGRYFYVQLLDAQGEINKQINRWKEVLVKLQRETNPPISDEGMDKLKAKALRFVGVTPDARDADGNLRVGALRVFTISFLGDLRLLFDLPKTAKGLSSSSRIYLRNYALWERRLLFLEPFQNLMGYWHTFHTPFAVFMYVAAFIHIVAALLFGVTR